MRCEIRYQPSYSLAVVYLGPGEEVQAEPGAMVAMSSTVELETEVKGGFLGALGRSVLGGESFFTSRYRARGGPGELALAPTLPGDIGYVELRGETFYLKSGAYLAADPDLAVDSRWGGARGFFGSGGLFLLRVQGTGGLLFTAYGALHEKELAPGERYRVDTGHVVGFSEGLNFAVRKAARGWFSTLASGEGLVCEFTGPGRVYLQTRSEEALVNWMVAQLPSKGD
ncbi:TIGR00266 family protein [Symbiobacterium thermophilum]|uniref:TIGR00266 family protein n=1 Tax=Symbiobacterium thermophilum TaxID=2734 RepID=A0A953IBY4_SYMTR|nr:TIGR00266 family protein [Symbiobacterium thermophilum]MBY6277934.1 TIGR00266 family protein [Symbiobacterium thermophilum]